MKSLILLLPVMVVLVILFLLYTWQRQRRRSNLQGQGVAGLSTSRTLIALLGHFQQHRGMTSAYLSGDASFLPRMKQKQGEIASLLPALLASAREENLYSHPCLTHNEVSVFQFNWKALLETLGGLPVEQAIGRHSQLITTLLEWLGALGEARLEGPWCTSEDRVRIRNFSQRFPQLTECLGQARAIGSGVAARKACPPVARVRLIFLAGRAESLLAQASEGQSMSAQRRIGLEAIQTLLSTIRFSLLRQAGIEVSSSDYFSLATRAIDAVYTWISEESVAIENRLFAAQGR